MEYYKIVIGIAFIIFFITIILFWYLNYMPSKEYPPIMANCPNGWTVNLDGTCNIPTDGTNMGNLYDKGNLVYKNISKNGNISYSLDSNGGGVLFKDKNGNPIFGYTGPGSNTRFPDFPAGYDINHPEKNIVNFTSEDWSAYGSTLCENRKWAIKNNIQWEGVTNYNHC
jgi:hypothetical protein